MDSSDAVTAPAVDPAIKARATPEILAVLARWIVGAAFLYMGMHKVLDPVGFLKLVRQYDIVTSPALLNCLAALLPWFEVSCGLLLLAGVAVRGTALVTLAMLLPFTLIVFRRALSVASAQGLSFCAVEFDCGCGGGEVLICRKLMENLGLILIAVWLATGRGKKLALRYTL